MKETDLKILIRIEDNLDILLKKSLEAEQQIKKDKEKDTKKLCNPCL